MAATSPGDRGIAAIVLAAGASSRIGRPKALLPLGGTTCIGLVLGACRDAGIAPIHVVVGASGGPVSVAASGPDVAIVWNDLHPAGQLSSFQTGIRSLPRGIEGVVAFPVDYPLVRALTLRCLVGAFRSEREGKTLFLPTHSGARGHPYLAATSVLPEYLVLPPGSMGRSVVLSDPERVREVPVGDEGILLDLDTPADFLALRSRIGQ
jgi:CTP:molybdopterin cytidylyltransferase MocA